MDVIHSQSDGGVDLVNAPVPYTCGLEIFVSSPERTGCRLACEMQWGLGFVEYHGVDPSIDAIE
jgi:hypothetical protein